MKARRARYGSTVWLVVAGLMLLPFGCAALLDTERLQAAFAGETDLARAPGEVRAVGVREEYSRRRGTQYVCDVAVGYRVAGRSYQTRRLPLEVDEDFPSPAEAGAYCREQYAVSDTVSVYYLRSKPEVASLDRRFFGDRTLEILFLASGPVGLALLALGLWRYRQELAGARPRRAA
jgi:hypothetical protein